MGLRHRPTPPLMGCAVSDPILVLDAYDTPHKGTPYLKDWLQELGIDPVSCFRVEVYAHGDGEVQSFHYARDGSGRLMVDKDGSFHSWSQALSLTAAIPAEVMPRRGSR